MPGLPSLQHQGLRIPKEIGVHANTLFLPGIKALLATLGKAVHSPDSVDPGESIKVCTSTGSLVGPLFIGLTLPQATLALEVDLSKLWRDEPTLSARPITDSSPHVLHDRALGHQRHQDMEMRTNPRPTRNIRASDHVTTRSSDLPKVFCVVASLEPDRATLCALQSSSQSLGAH